MDLQTFDVAKVPLPFTDKTSSKNRPALVLSSATLFNTPAGHSVMAMITSSTHTSWPLDCIIHDLHAAGLPAPSILRFKLFTLDHRLVRGILGHLSDSDKQQVRNNLRRIFTES